jgi:hypothetical protein
MIRYGIFINEKHRNISIMNNFDTMNFQKIIVWYFVAIAVWNMTIPSNIPLKKAAWAFSSVPASARRKRKKTRFYAGLCVI